MMKNSYLYSQPPLKLHDWVDENFHRVDRDALLENASAIHILEENLDRVDWYWLSENPAIFEIDYNALKKKIEPFKEELIQRCFHPTRLIYYLDKYNYDIGADCYCSEDDW